jgi:hypothetical protein
MKNCKNILILSLIIFLSACTNGNEAGGGWHAGWDVKAEAVSLLKFNTVAEASFDFLLNEATSGFHGGGGFDVKGRGGVAGL